MKKETEIWIPVIGYENYYEVSNYGRVKSITRKVKGRSGIPNKAVNERIRKTSMMRGYVGVVLSKEGKNKTTGVHRLIGQAFIPNPENKPWINHKNGIRDDNRIENLEWSTISENTSHAFRVLGRINPQKNKFGKDHNCYGKGVLFYKAKKVKCDTLDMIFDSAGEAARVLGISQPHLCAVCRGVKRHSSGLTFRYIN